MTLLRLFKILVFFLQLIFQILTKGDKAASWTREELAKLGATFVKLGQIVSVRRDMVSQVWIDELTHLQDNLPPAPFESIKQTIEAELGRPVEELFDFIVEKPIAVASIAQVHIAEYTLLNTRQRVAVKVQPPGVEWQFRTDIKILHRLKFLVNFTPGLMGSHAASILGELERTFEQELDLFNEAKNMSKFRSLFSDDPSVVIPKVDWGRTRKRILTSEYVQSTKITNLPTVASDKCKEASEIVLKAFTRQILQAGFFHADPHPGNLGVILGDNSTRVVFYDFGMIGYLPDETRDSLFALAEAVILGNVDKVVELVVKLGLLDRAALHNTEIREVVERILKGQFKQNPTTLVMEVREQLLSVSDKAELRYPRYFSMLGRAIFALEGSLQTIRPGVNLFQEAAPYAISLYPLDKSKLLNIDTASIASTVVGSARKIWGQIEGPVQVNDRNSIASMRKLRFAVKSISSAIISGSLLITAGLILQKSMLGFLITIGVAHLFLFRLSKNDQRID